MRPAYVRAASLCLFIILSGSRQKSSTTMSLHSAQGHLLVRDSFPRGNRGGSRRGTCRCVVLFCRPSCFLLVNLHDTQ